MSKMFAREELELMGYYEATSQHGLLTNLQTALPHITDKLSADTTANCIDKLCGMSSEAEFDVLQAQIGVYRLS